MEKNIELHPFEPFLPKGAKLLMLGTFPPSEKRWCMKFYYPNFTNDMWKIFGLCYFRTIYVVFRIGDGVNSVVEQDIAFEIENGYSKPFESWNTEC